jgi:hypothetical protein
MRSTVFVLLALLVAVVPGPAAGREPSANDAWRAAVSTAVRDLGAAPGRVRVSDVVMRLALAAGARELGGLPADEAAPLVYRAAVRAELRLRQGDALPRVRAALNQEMRVVARAGSDAPPQLRALDRAWRRVHRDRPAAGGVPLPWWMDPGAPRVRAGA